MQAWGGLQHPEAFCFASAKTPSHGGMTQEKKMSGSSGPAGRVPGLKPRASTASCSSLVSNSLLLGRGLSDDIRHRQQSPRPTCYSGCSDRSVGKWLAAWCGRIGSSGAERCLETWACEIPPASCTEMVTRQGGEAKSADETTGHRRRAERRVSGSKSLKSMHLPRAPGLVRTVGSDGADPS